MQRVGAGAGGEEGIAAHESESRVVVAQHDRRGDADGARIPRWRGLRRKRSRAP